MAALQRSWFCHVRNILYLAEKVLVFFTSSCISLLSTLLYLLAMCVSLYKHLREDHFEPVDLMEGNSILSVLQFRTRTCFYGYG